MYPKKDVLFLLIVMLSLINVASKENLRYTCTIILCKISLQEELSDRESEILHKN